MKKKLLVLASAALLSLSAQAAKTKIGFVYVGPTSDYGYNYAQDQGRQYLEENMPNVETISFENIPENADVQRVMERMIKSGVTIVFPTSYGYLDHALRVAEKYPEIHFMHSGGMKTSANLGTYFAQIDQAMYLSGIAAGEATKTNKLGFVAAHPIPQVLRNINAFTLGAQSVNPEITTSVIWTSSWSNPAKETEAANTLIDNGADVITGHVDSSINYIQTAERRNVYSVGYHADASKFAPNGWLVGATWNWGPMMKDIVTSIEDGTWKPEHLRGDLLTNATKITSFGSAMSEESIQNVTEKQKEIMSGDFHIWKGPLKDQNDKEILSTGKELTLEELEQMNFLVKGVQGRLK